MIQQSLNQHQPPPKPPNKRAVSQISPAFQTESRSQRGWIKTAVEPDHSVSDVLEAAWATASVKPDLKEEPAIGSGSGGQENQTTH